MNVNDPCLVGSYPEESSNICIHIQVADTHLVMEYNGFKLACRKVDIKSTLWFPRIFLIERTILI